jgi:hypothetical protein
MGDTKAGKTDYLMKAAEAGLNVLWVDGDVAATTLQKLSPAAKARMFYLPVHDHANERGQYESSFAEFIVAFTTQGKFLWNDSLCKPFDRKTYDPEQCHVVWEIIPSRMDSTCLLAIDSWTRLVASIVNWKAGDLGVDLLEIEKLERELYAGTGHKATQFLKLITGLKCHVGVIGHPREYIKRSAPKGSRGQVAEKEMKIDWIQMVPVSTSNPHGLTMGASFSDIGWIDVSAMGKRTIDFKPSDSRVIGGSQNTKEDVDVLTIGKLIELNQGHAITPAPADSWLTRYGPGEYVPAGGKLAPALGAKPSESTVKIPAPAPVVEASKPSGLGMLAGLKPSGVQR